MRNWLFHPLIFYPLAALLAVLVIAISVRPQAWPRQPAPVGAVQEQGALVFERAGFNTPDTSPEQNMTVTRDFWGRPQSLRIAVLPNQPPPTPAEQGVRILLTPQTAALIGDHPVTVDVSYNPLPVNAASGLAVSLQGIGPSDWVIHEAPSESGTIRFELPPQMAVNAIGLRAMSDADNEAYGLEITRIRIIPHA